MDVDQAIDALMELIGEVADDTKLWSQEESADIFEGVAGNCKDRADLIRSEME